MVRPPGQKRQKTRPKRWPGLSFHNCWKPIGLKGAEDAGDGAVADAPKQFDILEKSEVE